MSTELAWCAGFFDGEGHIRFLRDKNFYPLLRLQIGQKDRQVLDRFKKAVGRIGVGVRGPYDSGNRFILQVHNETAIAVFNMIKPYLSEIKLEQGRKAIEEFYVSRERMVA